MKLNKSIAVVVPAYNEAQILEPFYREMCVVIDAISDYNWTFYFVDDGSTDHTWAELGKLAAIDTRVRAIRLSRNFGKELALTAGAKAVCEFDAALFIDADLQHPPSTIYEMVKKWEEGYQIVGTVRETINYGLIRKIGASLFYWFLNRFSSIEIIPKSTDFQLLDRMVLNILSSFDENTVFFRGLVDWIGLEKAIVKFDAPMRAGGYSTFTLKDLFRLAIGSITSFSLIPLRVTGYLGALVMGISIFVLLYMLITDLTGMSYYTPLAYFTVFNTSLFGVVLMALGLIAVYIGHIHTEVVGRPMYIIRETLGTKSKNS